MTPRPPLGLTRPLAPTIAPPGSPAPVARRRGARLSWRRVGGAALAVSAHRDVHHHWPLTVNLLFPSSVTAPEKPSSRATPEATAAAPKRATKAGTIMVWERRDASRTSTFQAPTARAGTAPQLPALPSRPASAKRARQATPDDVPAFARTLHTLIERRWLHTQTTRHLPVEHIDLRRAPYLPADRHSPVAWRSRKPDIPLAATPVTAHAAASLSRPMRPDDRPLFTGDPLVHRSLRRIAVTPLTHRSTDTERALAGARATSPVRNAADIAPARRARAVRARPVEQVWADPRTAASPSFAQPFAPIFSSPGAAAPVSAFTPGPPATPAAPAVPDVNCLVDEVMRRIERQTRQDRLRRGM